MALASEINMLGAVQLEWLVDYVKERCPAAYEQPTHDAFDIDIDGLERAEYDDLMRFVGTKCK